MNKDATNITKQDRDSNINQQKVKIRENITINKAQQLYQKYITAMKILEDK